MEEKLSVITSTCVQKRIRQEIKQLTKLRVCIEECIEIIKERGPEYGPECEYSIKFKNQLDNKEYQFIVSNSYPFKPPKVYINDNPINFYHRITNTDFQNSLLKYTKIECFCCESILCSNNWIPNFTMKDIFEDINKCRDATHQVVVRIIVSIIEKKYLYSDANIISWLY
jgi:ubiquitin-protein ligase